ncbi:hypothetical protein ABBQ32_002638 [Trebouxia sp. C0010 RCD-2024]
MQRQIARLKRMEERQGFVRERMGVQASLDTTAVVAVLHTPCLQSLQQRVK